MIRKDYKPKPQKLQKLQKLQKQQNPPIKRWHIAAMAFLVFILAVDWDATLTFWGL
jgi:hypothetical protein